MIRPPSRLYHLADADNLPSILGHGLMSTARLLDLAGVDEPRRTTLIRGHRPESLRLSETIVIRDQSPMPPRALAPALDGGLEPSDWYELLNGFVFLWPDRERMERHRRACGSRPQSYSPSMPQLCSINSKRRRSYPRSIAATRGARLFGATATRWFLTGPGSSRDGRRASARDRRPNSCFVAACQRRRPT